MAYKIVVQPTDDGDECETCNKSKDNVVAFAVAIETKSGDVTTTASKLVYLCGDCVASAVNSAADDGEETTLVDVEDE